MNRRLFVGGTRRIAEALGMAWVYYPIVADDMNSHGIGKKFTGIVRDTLGTSDHDPVWAVAQLP